MAQAITSFCFSLLIFCIQAKIAPFIDPCKWNDKQCLRISSQKAVPFLAEGIPELGISPVDPLNINSVTVKDGEFQIVFNNIQITGLKQCKITDVERNIDEHWISLVLESPIDIKGQYIATGKLLFIPAAGDGPFHIKTDKIVIAIKMGLNIVDNHWQLSNYVHSFEFQEKALLQFDNLFNGDQTKAAPIQNILKDQWKELVQSIGEPIVAEAVKNVYNQIQKLMAAVPADELEI